jgi:cytoskeletal protein CcmA (bactofilin family)
MSITGVVTATTLNQTVTGATSFQGTTTFDNGFTVTGATGIITATGFSGPITGAVTGNVTGNADSATLATNAQGLTGTPNITVGTVAGTDATFSGNATVSGNLTVNGTTTTIDTAVTAVDSLAVDGDVNVGAAISAADYEGNFALDMYLFS